MSRVRTEDEFIPCDDAPDAESGTKCCARSSPRGYFCTRPPKHEGDHVARGSAVEVFDRWPQ